MIRLIVFLVFSLCLQCPIIGQELIPMGTWRTHFNYEEVFHVVKTKTKIFAATENALLYYDRDDLSLNTLSKIDGLSDVNVSAMRYNSTSEYLAIGYTSGHVDVINEDGIINLPVLYNSDVTYNKSINHVSFQNDLMNLSTDFGLLVLNIENRILEAYQNLGENGEVIKVFSSLVVEDAIYIASEVGVLKGSQTNGDNLQDFNNWERFSGSVVNGIEVLDLTRKGEEIYAIAVNGIYKQSLDVWSQVTYPLAVDEEFLKFGASTDDLVIISNQKVSRMVGSDSFTDLNFENGSSIEDVIKDGSDLYWYADRNSGLSKLENGNTEHFLLNGPLPKIQKLEVQSSQIFAFPQLDLDYSLPLTNGEGYSVFKNGEWASVGPSEIASFTNISDVHLLNDDVILSSFGNGVVKSNANQIFDYTNSPLQEQELGTENTLVTGIDQDSDGDIWLSNFNAMSLFQWDGNENWTAYDFGSSASSEPVSMSINDNDQIWMSLGLSSGFGVLGYEIESGESRYVNTTSTQLPSDQVNDIVFGKENEIWFATDLGIAYFPFSYGVIGDQSVDVILPTLDDNLLFENKQVLSLAVDGGNRLWVGTTDGLWHFSEDIAELLVHFDTENSPLPSNQVIDLSMHPETGELFIVTDLGVVSYRTDGSDATNIHQQVSIFPNPVLPSFTGWVGISGLASDVGLKITSVSGELIKEINAAGGSATWNLSDFKGQRVHAGIYLVFSSNEDGTETYVGKLAVID